MSTQVLFFLQANFVSHQKRKSDSRASREKDIELAKGDDKLLVATIDLQSVLQIPQSAESLFYYKRKICVYNLTI